MQKPLPASPKSCCLRLGWRAEAFDECALLTYQANSNRSIFKALAKKTPNCRRRRLLPYLVASTPGKTGKGFATVKALKSFEQATNLAFASPCDSKTLT